MAYLTVPSRPRDAVRPYLIVRSRTFLLNALDSESRRRERELFTNIDDTWIEAHLQAVPSEPTLPSEPVSVAINSIEPVLHSSGVAGDVKPHVRPMVERGPR